MTSSPPAWQAHDAANYDSTMTAKCTALLAEIVADPARRRAVISDPRDLHRELFAPFTPPRHSDYAGSYRGTPDTALASRSISAESQLQPGTYYAFSLPGEVSARMGQILQTTHHLIGESSTDDC